MLLILIARLLAGVASQLVTQLPTDTARILLSPVWTGTASVIISGIFVVLGFAMLVQAASSHQIRPRFSLIGGVVFFFLFRAGHLLYDGYLARFTNMGRLYGPFATIMILILWVYFSASLLLFCVHVVKALQRRVELGPRWSRRVPPAKS